MGEAGIIGPEERTELIEGEIYVMPPIGPGHAEGVWHAQSRLERAVGDRARVRVQNPIRLPDGSEPQPDVALVRPRPEGYKDAHPGPDDVLLVIEVAHSTLAFDRDVKLPLYARAGIPEAWLMNLPADRVEVHRDPHPDGYHSITIVTRDGTLTPAAFPDVSIRCDDVLP